MSIELTQLFPALRELKRAEKLYVIQFLVSELAQEETGLMQADVAYPVWSPYDAFAAADVMLKVLAAENVPLLLGQVNFFMEFNVCFYRSELAFEIAPKE